MGLLRRTLPWMQLDCVNLCNGFCSLKVVGLNRRFIMGINGGNWMKNEKGEGGRERGGGKFQEN